MADTSNPVRPSRVLPPRANLDHLKNEAKALLRELRKTDPNAKLATAQLTLAREYGSSSWRKLRADLLSQPISADRTEQADATDQLYPIVPLRDAVPFPGMVLPLAIGRAKSVRAVDQALRGSKHIFFVSQKDAVLEEPQDHDLYRVGTVMQILDSAVMANGFIKLLVFGCRRARLCCLTPNEEFMEGIVEFVDHKIMVPDENPSIPAAVSNFSQQWYKDHPLNEPEKFRALVMKSLTDPSVNLRVEELQKKLETL